MESKKSSQKERQVNVVALIFFLMIVGSAVTGNPLFILMGFAFCFLVRKHREREVFNPELVKHAEATY